MCPIEISKVLLLSSILSASFKLGMSWNQRMHVLVIPWFLSSWLITLPLVENKFNLLDKESLIRGGGGFQSFSGLLCHRVSK